MTPPELHFWVTVKNNNPSFGENQVALYLSVIAVSVSASVGLYMKYQPIDYVIDALRSNTTGTATSFHRGLRIFDGGRYLWL
jgi:hypothetical protein